MKYSSLKNVYKIQQTILKLKSCWKESNSYKNSCQKCKRKKKILSICKTEKPDTYTSSAIWEHSAMMSLRSA